MMDSQPPEKGGRMAKSVSFGSWRNITRDRVDMIIDVIGVAFAVLLMTVPLGL